MIEFYLDFCATLPMRDTVYVLAQYPLYKNLWCIPYWITSLYLWTNVLSQNKDSHTNHNHSFLQQWNVELSIVLNSHNDLTPSAWYHYVSPFSDTMSSIWRCWFLYAVSWCWGVPDFRTFEPLIRRDQKKKKKTNRIWTWFDLYPPGSAIATLDYRSWL